MSKFPPPDAFAITTCRRGRLTLQEFFAGFAIEIDSKPDAKLHWLSDGVDMFADENDEPISPGTLEWWLAAYEWLGDEATLMEAYFPEVT